MKSSVSVWPRDWISPIISCFNLFLCGCKCLCTRELKLVKLIWELRILINYIREYYMNLTLDTMVYFCMYVRSINDAVTDMVAVVCTFHPSPSPLPTMRPHLNTIHRLNIRPRLNMRLHLKLLSNQHSHLINSIMEIVHIKFLFYISVGFALVVRLLWCIVMR